MAEKSHAEMVREKQRQGSVINVRQLSGELSDATDRKVDRGKLSKFIVHRIDFSHDSGGDYWRGVSPVPRRDLDGHKVAWRFTDTRKVPGDDRAKDKHGRTKQTDFRDRPGAYTGGEIPYCFLGKYEGGIDQMIPISHYAPHARRWSWSGISYAVAGDFRERDDPTENQWRDVVDIGALCVSWLQRPVNECVFAHDELPAASKDPDKRCPGGRLDLDRLRLAIESSELAQMTKQQAEGYFLAIGVLI
jgi:hypothetical protein